MEPAESGTWRLVVGMGGERIPLCARFVVDASPGGARLSGGARAASWNGPIRLCGFAWRVDVEVDPWTLIEAAEIGW